MQPCAVPLKHYDLMMAGWEGIMSILSGLRPSDHEWAGLLRRVWSYDLDSDCSH